MPQDEVKALTTENAVVDGGKKVRPREDTTVYASKKSKHLGTEGTPHVVHACLAEKLIAKGEATAEAPKATAEAPKAKAKGKNEEGEDL